MRAETEKNKNDNPPDGPLTADAVSLPVADAAGLAESDTASRAGPVTQGAPEPATDQGRGGQHHQNHRAQLAAKHSPR